MHFDIILTSCSAPFSVCFGSQVSSLNDGEREREEMKRTTRNTCPFWRFHIEVITIKQGSYIYVYLSAHKILSSSKCIDSLFLSLSTPFFLPFFTIKETLPLAVCVISRISNHKPEKSKQIEIS